MPPQQSQAPQSPLDINTAKASMGIATRLNEQLLTHQATQMPQNAPPSTQNPSGDDNTAEKPDITKELTDFKKEIEGLLESKLGDIKREIEMALSEENDENTETSKTA